MYKFVRVVLIYDTPVDQQQPNDGEKQIRFHLGRRF